jgi:hypothetical protein
MKTARISESIDWCKNFPYFSQKWGSCLLVCLFLHVVNVSHNFVHVSFFCLFIIFSLIMWEFDSFHMSIRWRWFFPFTVPSLCDKVLNTAELAIQSFVIISHEELSKSINIAQERRQKAKEELF